MLCCFIFFSFSFPCNITQQTPLQKPKPKDDIPVPTIKTVETYDQDITADYEIKTSYVRYNRPSYKELKEKIEYVIDAEDEEWLRNNTKFGGAMASSTSAAGGEGSNDDETKPISSESDNGEVSSTEQEGEEGKVTKSKTFAGSPTPTAKVKTVELPIDMLEIMIDVLEKATGFEMIVSLGEAQDIILNRLPQLYQMYPTRAPRVNRSSVSEAAAAVAAGGGGIGDTANSISSGTAPVVTIRHVISDVHHYWMSKRSKLKRPLLRRFWPVTSTEDTNPHLVFRPREKEKYKLRKKRQNDMDAYRKLQQLKDDFSQIRLMLSMVRQREELNRSLVLLQKEWFEQKIYDAVDTSGLCRTSQRLDRETLDALMKVESIYDVQDSTGSGRRKKQSRRGSGVLGSRTASQSTSPVPESSSVNFGLPLDASGVDQSGDDGKLPMKIAGQNHGEPAPNFLHPLPTRENYTTSWEGSFPHVTTYVDSQPEGIARFRHRPRIGRGGRVVIDRVPISTDPNFPPDTYFTAGHAPAMTQEQLQQRPKERLLDLLPQPLDHNELSRRIEDICLTALQEDYNSTYQAAVSSAGVAGSPSAASAAALAAAATAAAGGGTEAEENDGRAVVVSMKDWLDTDDQLWGEERYAIGPI